MAQSAGQFQKGKSGNPGGRPSLPEAIKKKLRDRTPKNVASLIELADQRDDLGVAFRATLTLHEMYYGKPVQPDAHDIPEDGVVAKLAEAEVNRRFAEILRDLPRTVGIPKTKM